MCFRVAFHGAKRHLANDAFPGTGHIRSALAAKNESPVFRCVCLYQRFTGQPFEVLRFDAEIRATGRAMRLAALRTVTMPGGWIRPAHLVGDFSAQTAASNRHGSSTFIQADSKPVKLRSSRPGPSAPRKRESREYGFPVGKYRGLDWICSPNSTPGTRPKPGRALTCPGKFDLDGYRAPERVADR